MSRVWYALVAAAVLIAMVGTLVMISNRGGGVANFFSYFTVESNLLTLATALWFLIDPAGRRGGDLRQYVRIAALTGIAVTGVVYATLIAPNDNPSGAENVYNVLFHYLSPLMMVVGFVALRPCVALAWCHVAFIAWPLSWLAYTMTRAAVSNPGFAMPDGTHSRYPYDFLDPSLHGWRVVGLMIAVVAVVLVAIASAYVGLSRRFAAQPDQLHDRPLTTAQRNAT